jgi:hypothetical protein
VQVRFEGVRTGGQGAVERGHGILRKGRLVAPVPDVQGQPRQSGRGPGSGSGCPKCGIREGSYRRGGGSMLASQYQMVIQGPTRHREPGCGAETHLSRRRPFRLEGAAFLPATSG